MIDDDAWFRMPSTRHVCFAQGQIDQLVKKGGKTAEKAAKKASTKFVREKAKKKIPEDRCSEFQLLDMAKGIDKLLNEKSSQHEKIHDIQGFINDTDIELSTGDEYGIEQIQDALDRLAERAMTLKNLVNLDNNKVITLEVVR